MSERFGCLAPGAVFATLERPLNCDVNWFPLFHRHCGQCSEPCSVNARACGTCMAAMVQDPMGYCQICGDKTPTLLCDVCNIVTTRIIQRAMGVAEAQIIRIPRVDDEHRSHGEFQPVRRDYHSRPGLRDEAS